MNKRGLFSGFVILPRTHVPAYLICAALFVLGTVTGTFLSAGFCESGGAAEYMAGYLPSLALADSVGTFRYFLLLLRYPLLVFFLGFSVLGTIGIPALSFGRGFTMAFALSVFTRLYAVNGALMALLLFGGVSALSIPVFLLVASGAFLSSVRLGRIWFSIPAPIDPFNSAGAYFLRFILAMLTLLLLAVGERAVLGSGLLSLPIFS